MSILDVNLADVPDLTTVPGGTEVEVQISSLEQEESKAGNPMLTCRLKILNEENVGLITNYLTLPIEADDDETKNSKLRRLKRFCESFGIDFANGIDLEASRGKTSWAIVNEEISEEFGAKNTVKRFVAGR